MKILSLFDGMACGMISMLSAGVDVESYDAYEIDKYAIALAKHNFPKIQQHGDVFNGDFNKYEGVDFLIGGSPCTHWSIAQKKNRETTASGVGWDLFSQYVRALYEAKPKYFIYENNYSMSKEIRASIDETFGFEAVHINSALVSAQNRQRLYWVGKRNANGGYDRVNVAPPCDRGIQVRDILEYGVFEKRKAYCLKHQAGNARDYFKKHHTNIAFVPVRVPEFTEETKSRALSASYANKGAGEGTLADKAFNEDSHKQRCDFIAEAVNQTKRGKSQTLKAQYSKNGFKNFLRHDGMGATGIAEPIQVGAMPRPNGTLSRSQAFRVYSICGKSVVQNSGGGGAGGKTGLYAIPTKLPWAEPTEFDESGKPTKARSGADGKIYDVFEVADGKITIKAKAYPIKLLDGYYIIRKFTVRECARLQTVPEWYDFSVISNTQAYKCLGNGWTVEVIVHLIKACLAGATVKTYRQTSIFD